MLRPWLLGLAVCSIVIAPLAAWAQRDLKRMVAYLSINHLGYCMLGLFAVTATSAAPAVEAQAALSGVFLQIFNHGLTAAALFYFVGLLDQRRGARGLGLLITAIVFLRAMQALFSGPLAESCGTMPDLRLGEKWIVIPVALLMFALGIYPQFVLNIFNTTVAQMARLLG